MGTTEGVFKEAWRMVRPLYIVGAVFAVLVAVAFGALILGDALGLWFFDSGLGCEAGDGVCRGDH